MRPSPRLTRLPLLQLMLLFPASRRSAVHRSSATSVARRRRSLKPKVRPPRVRRRSLVPSPNSSVSPARLSRRIRSLLPTQSPRLSPLQRSLPRRLQLLPPPPSRLPTVKIPRSPRPPLPLSPLLLLPPNPCPLPHEEQTPGRAPLKSKSGGTSGICTVLVCLQHNDINRTNE
ncbi:hypothetical protein H112_00917 [Trichophyton rubrum D6]|uniref:Uncharacterized protein n=2 Tax=Trichophyton rubrum TaxID=5551 RepID=A0A080WJJ0_TRIRC|nr:uncharacterized protein TERG_12631 [Trichophyton rubrum CBS 118892]EZF46073.1 hypothetical protein H102_00908 [Trichophyton rubrum CBS 100081]EZF56729.1 hypothetical protein H103_00916 [Trichophyton rubrum CBS 288.86]EZF67362.1 hypothetical protein H104_00900 [Trichophyton rubrum CBS 289.86]EZF88631.1 hypothetical protein H110_00917 [Trichophyton rubrum MR1448]EZF99434.1 hypothetical protein H113_00917 [Trichophyton rubrum MR1459]EZG10680.1 hypothetical protein H106_00713 [Trichophyton rub